MNTDFRYTSHSLAFRELSADLGSSHLSNELIFSYDKMADFSDFNKKVKIKAHLDSTVISTQDLTLFAPSLKRIKDHWTMYGAVKGTVSNFESKKLNFYFGKHSKIAGEVGLDGLPDINETFIEFNLGKSVLYPTDVRQYLTNDEYYAQFVKFGKVNFDARFNGFPSQFTADGNFMTDLGYLETDIQFKINKNLGRSEYEGGLVTKDFQLGKFLNNEKLGNINIKGKVDGYGFTIEKAQLNMNAKVSKFDLLGYPYQGITVNGHLKNEYFNGDLTVVDPNLELKSKGRVDLRDEEQKIRVKAKIEKANMKALHFSDDSLSVSTLMDVDFKGFTIDDIIGKGDFKNTLINYKGKELKVANFNFSSFKKDSLRNFSVKSSIVKFDAKGDFEFMTVADDIELLLKEYQLKLANSQDEIANYYAKKKVGKNYAIDFKLDLLDTKPVLDLFIPELSIAKGTILKGQFTNSAELSKLKIHSVFDSIRMDRLSLEKNSIKIVSTKKRYANDVRASYRLTSTNQKLGKKQVTKNFDLSGDWNNKAFTYSSNLSSLNNKNGYKINGDVSFMKDSTVFKMYDTDFKFDNHHVHVNDTNLIGAKGKKITFEHFELIDRENNQKHILSGEISPSRTSKVVLSLHQFNLNYISLFAKTELHGDYTGDIILSDFYNTATVTSDFEMINFGLYDGRFGDFKGNVNWNEKDKHINLDVDLFSDTLKLAEISGYVNTDKKTNKNLNLKLNLNHTPLNLIEPYMKGHVSHMGGKATGEIKIIGDFVKPNFYGKPHINNGGFTIEYLKTHYVFDDIIYFNKDKITFKGTDLVDTLDYTNAKLNGYIQHSLFKNFYVDVSVDLNKTLLQNTKKEDNELYYGPVYATGKVGIKGPFEELIIHSNEITSEKGTYITIPLDNEGAITQSDFIHFVDKDEIKDSLTIVTDEKVSLTGITINLNMNITEDALINIVFDEKTGDRLIGYGNGLLKVDLSTKGDFNMYGNYEITKGDYLFSMLNVLNKSFTIDKGSRITWNGNPYDGKMNVKAKYSVLTSITPLLIDSAFIATHPDVKRPNPVDVALIMNGNLMSPDINFGISIEDYPNYLEVEQAILDFKNRIKYNEQELNKQVFSLIILKTLSPLDRFNANISSTAGASVSEMFSNQLGSMLSQIDEDLEVYIDLGGLAKDGNALNVRLSYSVLDGRLRISHNGNYSNTKTDQGVKNLVGEWTIEYLVSNDGKIRLKGYNKLNQNTTSTSISSQNSTVYGVSLSYNDNYDSISEFWSNLKNKFRRKRKKPKKDEEPNDIQRIELEEEKRRKRK